MGEKMFDEITGQTLVADYSTYPPPETLPVASGRENCTKILNPADDSLAGN